MLYVKHHHNCTEHSPIAMHGSLCGTEHSPIAMVHCMVGKQKGEVTDLASVELRSL